MLNRHWFVGIASLSLLAGCSAAPHTTPALGTTSARSAIRAVLTAHRWHIVRKGGDIYDYNGFAVLKRNGSQRFLEMRTRGQAQQFELSDVVSARKDDARVVQGERRTSVFEYGCSDPSLCCDVSTCDSGDLFDPNQCDPSVSFCCPDRFGGSLPCAGPPQIIIDGMGCEDDQPCGDDGNGTTVGVGYFIFPNHYCWYDFVNVDWQCFQRTGGLFGAPELFAAWTRTSTAVQMECKPSGYDGRGFAYYYDPKSVGVGNFSFNASNPKFIGYPISFPGFGGKTSVKPAKMSADFYRFGIPTPFTKVGTCNHAEV